MITARGCALAHIYLKNILLDDKDRDIEKLKFGHKDASKKEAAAFLVCAGLVYRYRDELWNLARFINPSYFQLSVDQYVSMIALFTVVPHFVEIIYQYGFLRGTR